MKIAVFLEGENVAPRLEVSREFQLYKVDGSRQRSSDRMVPGDAERLALVAFLRGLETDLVICGRIGSGMLEALQEDGIAVIGGISGRAEDALKAYLAGTLAFPTDFVIKESSSHHSK